MSFLVFLKGLRYSAVKIIKQVVHIWRKLCILFSVSASPISSFQTIKIIFTITIEFQFHLFYALDDNIKLNFCTCFLSVNKILSVVLLWFWWKYDLNKNPNWRKTNKKNSQNPPTLKSTNKTKFSPNFFSAFWDLIIHYSSLVLENYLSLLLPWEKKKAYQVQLNFPFYLLRKHRKESNIPAGSFRRQKMIMHFLFCFNCKKVKGEIVL